MCENSGLVFPIADPFQEPVSSLAGRNPALRLAQSSAQLGVSGAVQLQVPAGECSAAATEQMHLGFGKHHELTRFVWVKEQ